MIKAILFDFGNVIYGIDNNIFLENIKKHTDKSVPELHRLIYGSSDLTRRYETGMMSSDEFYHEMVTGHDLSISKPEFVRAYTQIFVPIQTTVALIRKLKKNYKIGVISNTSEWDYEHIIKPSEVYNLFDAISLSFRVKAMKPDRMIFEDALRKLAMRAEACVYIDDIEHYVSAARDMGMHGIHYQSYNRLILSLNRLGIRV
jgi:putative hydrolase of the HAD superfamily